MASSKIRKAAVAGQFYPKDAKELSRQISSLVNDSAEKQDVIACMLPHAGYIYSGKVATETLSHINLKEKIILLGPNHTGEGAPFSVMAEGTWRTPLGDVEIDEDLAKGLLDHSKYLENDSLAHLNEHSLEVELPFLQYFKKNFQIVPVAFMSNDAAALKQVGKDIATAIERLKLKDSAMIVASSDMTHYEPQEVAKSKDNKAIEAILELSEDKLIERIRSLGISMCGYAPAIVMISAAKAMGAKKAKLIKYQTSAEVTHDTDSVVGYAGIIIY